MFERIEKWLSGFKKYLFTYKDGFFEMPYLANSPETTVNSLIAMPFNKHFIKEHRISTNNPFVSGNVFYQKIEDGLWLNIIDLTYKANVSFKEIYDEDCDDDLDYYIISYYIITNTMHLPEVQFNGIKYTNKGWTMCKPRNQINSAYYKHTHGLYFNFSVSKKWIKDNLMPEIVSFGQNPFFDFIHSTVNHVVWADLDADINVLCADLYEFMSEKERIEIKNPAKLKAKSLDFFELFKIKFTKTLADKNYLEINVDDRKKLIKAEKILVENLYTVFPGIENLAQTIGLSSSKFRDIFKACYGETIFQFYRKKQMIIAKEMILKEDFQIKEIAQMLGYENASKFSVAFKNHHGFLPSKMLKISP